MYEVLQLTGTFLETMFALEKVINAQTYNLAYFVHKLVLFENKYKKNPQKQYLIKSKRNNKHIQQMYVLLPLKAI